MASNDQMADPRAAEIAHLRFLHEADRRTIERWVPCADHRDKTTRGVCYVCENQRLRQVIAKLVAKPMDPGTLAWAQREIADGRAFK